MRSPGTIRRTRAALLATVAAVGLLAAACGSTSSSTGDRTEGTVDKNNTGLVETGRTDTITPGGKIVYGLSAETNGWNPGTNQWAPSGLQVTRAIFDTLSAFDEHSQIRPFLAEAFEHDADNTHWTIKLRAGVKLHNGKPVDATVVQRNLSYLKASPVVGGAFLYVKSITVKDPRSVAIELTEPWANFPILLASQVGVVGDPDWMESKDSLEPVGTGPFVFDKWEIGNELTVQKNTDYWRKDAQGVSYPYLDSIEFRVMGDPESRAKALKARDIDIMETFSGSQIQDFKSKTDVQVFSSPTGELSEDFVLLNTQVPPFDDVDARRALAYATDKKTFIDVLNGGLTEPANGIFQPSSPWYAESGYPQYDPVKAKELVEKVKAKHGSFSFKVMASPSPDGQRGSQILQQQWADVGIQGEIEVVEQATIIIKVVTGSYQATNWIQFSAPDAVLDSLWIDPALSTAPPAFSLNFSRLKDDQLGEAFRKARASSDPAVRKEAFKVVQERMSDQVPFVFLFHQQVAIVATSRVQNITNWTLPDGTKGLDLQEGAHPVYQISLKSS